MSGDWHRLKVRRGDKDTHRPSRSQAGLEGHVSEPVLAKDGWQPPEARKGEQRFSPGGFVALTTLGTPGLGTSGLQKCEKINCCGLATPDLWDLVKSRPRKPIHLLPSPCGVLWSRREQRPSCFCPLHLTSPCCRVPGVTRCALPRRFIRARRREPSPAGLR